MPGWPALSDSVSGTPSSANFLTLALNADGIGSSRSVKARQIELSTGPRLKSSGISDRIPLGHSTVLKADVKTQCGPQWETHNFKCDVMEYLEGSRAHSLRQNNHQAFDFAKYNYSLQFLRTIHGAIWSGAAMARRHSVIWLTG